MQTIVSKLYHSLPDGWKRRIRLYTYSYNDVAGGGKTKFKDRIEREMKRFLSAEDYQNKALASSIRKDIKHCWLKYGSSPEEYFLFGYRNLNDNERGKFVTDYVKDMTLKKSMGLSIFASELQDKYNFYNLTAPFFKRRAFKVSSETSESDFVLFAQETQELFVKPMNKSRGRGAHVVIINELKDAKREYATLIAQGGDWMIEEVIHQSEYMSKWNQSSVNTIRVPSFLNQSGFSIVGPVIRTGRKGAIVDNAGSGGIVASIDVASGEIITDGYDEQGRSYTEHPDSHIKYKGSEIPQWEDLKCIIEKVHRTCMPKHIYIGWDVALTDKGWVIIEGNWGQFLSQYSDHIGIKDVVIPLMKLPPITH